MTITHSRRIKAIVVDDEPLARCNLRALIKGVPDIELTKECGNGRDAVSSIRALEPDLVFLDVLRRVTSRDQERQNGHCDPGAIV
jgi:two-component system, LytTR family, response regulator